MWALSHHCLIATKLFQHKWFQGLELQKPCLINKFTTCAFYLNILQDFQFLMEMPTNLPNIRKTAHSYRIFLTLEIQCVTSVGN